VGLRREVRYLGLAKESVSSPAGASAGDRILVTKSTLVESPNSWTNASNHSNITSHRRNARATCPNLFSRQPAHLCGFLEFGKNTCVENEKKHAPSRLTAALGAAPRRESICSTCAAPKQPEFRREHRVSAISIPTFVLSPDDCKQVWSPPLPREPFPSCCHPNRLLNQSHL